MVQEIRGDFILWRNSYLLLVVLGVLFFLFSCGVKRPVLYPNVHLKEVGEEVAQRDIDECLRLAAEAGLEKNQEGEVAGKTAKGAVKGTVVGGAVGAVTGDVGRGAGIGAAAGGTSGLMGGLFSSKEPDPIQKQFVEQCLRERGYQPIGWR